MKPIYSARLSMLILPFLHRFLPSGPSAVSLACDQCGSSFNAHGAVGTSEYILTGQLNAPNLSPYRFSLVLTNEGKLSILCGCSQSARRPSDPNSGADDGTSFSPVSSDESITALAAAKEAGTHCAICGHSARFHFDQPGSRGCSTKVGTDHRNTGIVNCGCPGFTAK